jgi:hypothetical protein
MIYQGIITIFLTKIEYIMKRLNKMQINPERLMKNEELLTLRGGYDFGWVSCRQGSIQICNWPVATCEGEEEGSAKWYCNTYCPQWDNLICAGG